MEIVLKLEQDEMWVAEKGEVDDLNELMYKIAKPIEGKGNGKGKEGKGVRRSVIEARTSVFGGGEMIAEKDFGALEKLEGRGA